MREAARRTRRSSAPSRRRGGVARCRATRDRPAVGGAGRRDRAATASGRCGKCSRRASEGAPHEHAGSVARRRRGAGAAERARRLRAARRGDHRCGSCRAARSPRRRRASAGPFFDPGATRRTGIRSSTRCRAACAAYDERRPCSQPPPRRRTTQFEYLLRLGDDRLVLGHRLSRVVRPRADSRGRHRARQRRARPASARRRMFLRLRRRGRREGTRRGRARVFPRRGRVPQLPARRAAEGRLRVHDRATVPVRRRTPSSLLERCSAATNAELAGDRREGAQGSEYHVRHSGEWVLKLGDGTEESHRRAQRALDELWRLHAASCSRPTTSIARLAAHGIAPDLPALARTGRRSCATSLSRATLTLPHDGVHSHLAAAARDATPSTSAPARRDADRRPLAPGSDMVSERRGARRARSPRDASTR